MKKIASTLFSKHIILESGILYNLIIENKNVFHKTVNELLNQISNKEGNTFVLPENSKILDISKYSQLITDIFSICIDDKSSISTLYKFADKEILDDDLLMDLHELTLKIGDFIDKSKTLFDFDIDYDSELKLSSIYKMVNVTTIIKSDVPTHKLLEFMKFQHSFQGKEIFFIVNLKSFFDIDDIQTLIEETAKIGINVINISAFCYPNCPIYNEVNIILDIDLCEVS